MPHAGSRPDDHGLYRIGCLGRLSSFSETDDGRYLITLTGLIRFAVAAELPMRRGYRRMRGDFAGFVSDLMPDEPQPLLDREGLLAALRSYFSRRGFEANWDAIKQMPEGMLVVTLAMACPFEPMPRNRHCWRQPTPADRATTLLALLQMDQHGGRPSQGRQAELMTEFRRIHRSIPGCWRSWCVR